jgi:hypothetical protein
MHKIIIIILSISWLAGCNSTSRPAAENAHKDSTQITDTTRTVADTAYKGEQSDEKVNQTVLPNPSKPAENAASSNEYLIFGSGGGIAALVTQYKLTADGALIKTSGPDKKSETVGKIQPAAVAKLLTTAKDLGDPVWLFSQPGDKYYFITLKSFKSERTVKWGKPGTVPPPEAKALYDELMKLVTKK